MAANMSGDSVQTKQSHTVQVLGVQEDTHFVFYNAHLAFRVAPHRVKIG